MPTMNFDAKITRLCRLKGWDQSALNKAAGDPVSPSTMSAYFAGKSRPSMDVALKLARDLGVGLEFLADDLLDDEPKPDDLTVDEQQILRLCRLMGSETAIKRLSIIPESDGLTEEERELVRQTLKQRRTGR